VDPNTGKEKLEENLPPAVDAYFNHVDGCPCGASNIQLFKGYMAKHS